MSRYFDEDFFKFLMGFIAIIALSLIIVLATRMYKEQSELQTASAFKATRSQ